MLPFSTASRTFCLNESAVGLYLSTSCRVHTSAHPKRHNISHAHSILHRIYPHMLVSALCLNSIIDCMYKITLGVVGGNTSTVVYEFHIQKALWTANPILVINDGHFWPKCGAGSELFQDVHEMKHIHYGDHSFAYHTKLS